MNSLRPSAARSLRPSSSRLLLRPLPPTALPLRCLCPPNSHASFVPRRSFSSSQSGPQSHHFSRARHSHAAQEMQTPQPKGLFKDAGSPQAAQPRLRSPEAATAPAVTQAPVSAPAQRATVLPASPALLQKPSLRSSAAAGSSPAPVPAANQPAAVLAAPQPSRTPAPRASPGVVLALRTADKSSGVGGAGTTEMVVDAMLAGSPAAACGQIQRGDVLAAVDGIGTPRSLARGPTVHQLLHDLTGCRAGNSGWQRVT